MLLHSFGEFPSLGSEFTAQAREFTAIHVEFTPILHFASKPIYKAYDLVYIRLVRKFNNDSSSGQGVIPDRR